MNPNLPINTLSASALDEWLGCPRKFRLRRVDRVQPAFRPVALAFGSAWHDVIGYLLFSHGRGESVPRDELGQRLRDKLTLELRSDGPPVLFEDEEDAGGLTDLGIRMLDAFLDQVPLPNRVLGVEVPFDIEVHDPETGEVLPIPIIGSLDAVVKEDRTPVLWELKSGKRRWSEDKLLFDLQATIYRTGAKSRGLKDPEQKVLVTTKAARPQVQVERLVRTNAHERDLHATASSVVRAVVAGVDHPVRSWACKTCAFAGVCR